jgi:hypothetical protein
MAALRVGSNCYPAPAGARSITFARKGRLFLSGHACPPLQALGRGRRVDRTKKSVCVCVCLWLNLSFSCLELQQRAYFLS